LTEIKCELALSTVSDDEKPIVTIRRLSQQISSLRVEMKQSGLAHGAEVVAMNKVHDQLSDQLAGMVNGQKQDQAHIEKLEEINTGLWAEQKRFFTELDRLHDIEHKCQSMGRELHETLAAYEQLKGRK